MKVNPTSSDSKALLATQSLKNKDSGASLQSLNRSKSGKREKKFNCAKLLSATVEGKYWIIMMTFITLFALFGVFTASHLTLYVGRHEGLAH